MNFKHWNWFWNYYWTDLGIWTFVVWVVGTSYINVEVWISMSCLVIKILCLLPNSTYFWSRLSLFQIWSEWSEGGTYSLPVDFLLITQKRQKLQPWHFAAFSNVLFETFMPKLVSLTRPSPDIELNSYGGIFNFRISGQCLIKKNGHNSRTSNDIDMELGPVTKLDKGSTTTFKKKLWFFQFMAN